MRLPIELIESLKETKGFDKEAFEKVHATGEQITSIRLNPSKSKTTFADLQIFKFAHSKIAWSQYGYYLKERPSFTFDPQFHAGCYYVQEASSMFLEQVLKQTVDLSRPLKILDLCAAPGGKSTHIQSLISKDSLLVSNEVIRGRANILKDNIIKWGCENVVVTNNDPAHFSRLVNYFDVIVVDAPCSGSGLFRRDPAAIDEWSENNVQLCCQRQQRILADVWPALKNDGLLIYSTCSYSEEEDEDILDWIAEEFKGINQKLKVEGNWNIVETVSSKGNAGYRFWPDKVKGEGFFTGVFRKQDGDNEKGSKNTHKQATLTKQELSIIQNWADTEGKMFIRNEYTVYAWPEKLVPEFNLLIKHLRMNYSGTIIGDLIRDKLVPDHALAMCQFVNPEIKRTELYFEEAIQYLQRKDIHPEQAARGWQLVTYQGYSLGWINVLSNRINNYYPKELRILKDN